MIDFDHTVPIAYFDAALFALGLALALLVWIAQGVVIIVALAWACRKLHDDARTATDALVPLPDGFGWCGNGPFLWWRQKKLTDHDE